MMRGYSTDGWDWAWMVPLMLFWIALLAGAIYGAVRLAASRSGPEGERRSTASRFEDG
jgi:flagellar biogenesis protein FliO